MLTAIFLAAAALASAEKGVGAWVVPWDKPAIEEIAGCFSEINPFVYSFDQAGRPKLVDAALLKKSLAAKSAGAKVVPVIVNDVLDGSGKMQEAKSIALLTKLLNTDELVDKHLQTLMSEVWSDQYDGLELDYERIPNPLYPRFARLVEKLAAELHKRGKTLAVDLEPGPIMRRGQPGEEWWPKLAKSADALKVMVYYETGSFSENPGAGASLPWARQVAAKSLRAVPASKLVLAFSLAGTDWELPYQRLAPDRKVNRIQYKQVRDILNKKLGQPAFDAALGAPHLLYQANDHSHDLWYEDEQSLKAKLDLASSLNARAGLWFVGRVHPDLNSLGLCRP